MRHRGATRSNPNEALCTGPTYQRPHLLVDDSWRGLPDRAGRETDPKVCRGPLDVALFREEMERRLRGRGVRGPWGVRTVMLPRRRPTSGRWSPLWV